MTLQTTLLDVRLAQAVVAAQRGAAADPVVGNTNRSAIDLPQGLLADLPRTLRQFGLLQRERASIELALTAAPAEQRRQAQSRLTSFDADLARLLGRAARLAFLLLTLRRRSADAPGFDGAQAVQCLGTLFGQTLDSTRLRGTVQRFATQPMGAAVGVEPGALTEALFIALALVMALAPSHRGAA